MLATLKEIFVKKELLVVFVVAVILSFAVLGNGISGDFVFDDATVIQNRGDVKDLSNFFDLAVSPYHQNTPQSGLYRPFTIMSYALNYHVFGSSPTSFHVVNIIIHALNSFLVFWLVNYLFKNKFLSYITFLLFLVHPIHAEAVTSIVGRAELLAFFWSLVATYFFIKKDAWLSSVSFFFALLSKEIALMVLPIIFYVNWIPLKNGFLTTVRRTLVFALPVLVYVALRYKALGAYFLGDATTTIVENPLKFMPFGERILTAFKVLYMYLERLFWPVRLSADYSYNTILPVQSFLEPTFLAGAGFFGFLLWLLFFSRIRHPSGAFGALVFLAPYLMISNLIKPVGTIMGERLMYFPSFGFIIILALGLNWFIGRGGVLKKFGYVIIVALVCFYGVRTIIRNNDWQNNDILFHATVKESPNGLITRNALAGVYIRSNEWEKAEGQLEIAKDIYEDNARLQNLLGVFADHEGNFSLAEEKYERSIELNPNLINARVNLSELYLKQKRFEEAGQQILKVIDFYPTTGRIVQYAYIQIAAGKPDEALRIINEHFGSDLSGAEVIAVVGTAYFVKSDYDKAVIFLKKAVELGNTALEVIEMLQISERNL